MVVEVKYNRGPECDLQQWHLSLECENARFATLPLKFPNSK